MHPNRSRVRDTTIHPSDNRIRLERLERTES